jgi:protein TonB
LATYSLTYSDQQDKTIVWALVLSVGLHLLALTQIPNIEFEQEPAQPDTLTVELLPPAPPQPQPVSEPEAEPAPEPPKPEIKPKPEKKPVLKELPSPIAEPPNEIAKEQPPAPPPIMTAAPKAEIPPVVTAPPPPPEPPKVPSQVDIDDARNLYGGLLTREIAKHKQYPNVARMRGWQGEAMIELKIDSNGQLLSSRIVTSSGYEVLDKQGLEMVRKASPFPPPPTALRGRNFEILVPVSFKLE